ncbi:uncharacterized protein LOC113329197 [Papaver somniferum]|uniref:uncharacterized protein LOC113329197 n=1 Tax=Papaver somniferum TaxID=3469 RepID=UPI000E7012A8|nr:uncharacterized protein LOC113329197 [Papaver somniferum]
MHRLKEDTTESDNSTSVMNWCQIEASILESDFTEEEVLHVINDLANDMAPGPDGFPIMFFQKCWHFIKEDIMGTVNEFCTTGTINPKHNSTFITLVPKKDHIETIKDCRPICLLTSVYKIIAKVLSTKLKLVMDKLISPVQCAYIEGRQITDGTLIANELVDSRLRYGNAGIVCNIDLEKVNTSKTRTIAVGDVPNLATWEEEFGCSTDCLPFMYLGMPLGANSGSKRIWDPILEKFDARLSVWRKISLSRGGKLGLLKCILSSLPTYYFSLFKAPISCINILEKKMRNFLWEYKEGAKTSHLVNWDLVRATKEKGGLGVCDLKLMNLALLAKWCWRFGVEKNKLWYKIVEDKYGTDFSKWIPGNITETYGVSRWRVIAGTASLISENSTLFVHSGSAIAFWNDIWCGQLPLASVSPNLYKLSTNRNVTIANMISLEGNWKFEFKRVLTNQEVEEYASLLTIIGDNPPIQDALPDTRR